MAEKLESEPQPALVRYPKSKYFRLHKFVIGSIAMDKDPIDIVDSEVEALLVDSRWIITNVCSRNIGLSLALPDKTN